nr:hypothetical protein [Tanacetum cinerariifolium]
MCKIDVILGLAFLSEVVASHYEGEFMLVAPDVFSTMVANLFRLLLLLVLALPSETEVSEPGPLTLEFELILEMEEARLKSIPEHTTIETPMNMSPENKAHFEAEKEAIHLILTGIRDEIYSTVDACQTAQEMWEAIERFYKMMNEMIRNNLTVATMQVNVQFLPQLQLEWLRTYTTTRYKGKEIAKPITPPFETASKEDIDPEQAQRDKDMQNNLALIAKYFKKIYKPTNNNLKTSSNLRNKNVDTTPRHFAKECRKPKRVKDFAYHMEKMLLCKQAEQGVPLQAEQCDWLEDTDEEIDEHNTCLVETDDSNVFPNLPNMCDDDIQNDQNDVESDDERVALANLIANLKLDTEFDKYKAFNDRTVDYEKLEHALAELQCLYLYKVQECDYFAQKLSKQTKSVSKKVHTELLQRFAKVEKHSTSLEIAFQKCKEQVKNDTVWNEQASNVFQKEREQYIEIQDLKAQQQDKNIAISELKKLIEKGKGKSVETKFDKPFFIRQPNAQRIPKPSVLGKPTPFSNSLERRYFSKTKSVPKTNVLESLSKPVTAQTLPQTTRQAVSNTNVLKPGMYRIDNKTTQTRAKQSPQNVRNTYPHVSTSTGVNHKTNVSKPQHRSNQFKDKVMPNC